MTDLTTETIEAITEATGRDKLMASMKNVIADAEELLRATAGQAGEKAQAARVRVEGSLRQARLKLADSEEAARRQARAAAQAADEYVHENPWTALGLAAAVGVIVGVLIARR
jgi:ElaB/YqjD/DUF883 family membrane-anchored ribosome-binding protein